HAQVYQNEDNEKCGWDQGLIGQRWQGVRWRRGAWRHRTKRPVAILTDDVDRNRNYGHASLRRGCSAARNPRRARRRKVLRRVCHRKQRLRRQKNTLRARALEGLARIVPEWASFRSCSQREGIGCRHEGAAKVGHIVWMQIQAMCSKQKQLDVWRSTF